MTSAAPTNPSSSPATVKMKSVCWAGTNLPCVCAPWKSPWPSTPPEPMAISDWRTL